MYLVNLTKKQAGMGLIESLVALLIISIGLLGIAALQITSVKQSSSAQWHSQAVWFSYEMTDRINANRGPGNVNFNLYDNQDTDHVTPTDCQGGACTPIGMVNADIADWADMVQTLPIGIGIISSVGNTLNVTVMWDDDSDENNCIAGIDGSDGMTCYTVTIQ